jgi:hypothetical protein
MTTTTFENKTTILADLWLNYRNDTEFVDFIEYNDLGLPLAYAINEGIVDTTELATNFVNETFDLLLAGLGISEDTGFDTMEDLFGQSADDNA